MSDRSRRANAGSKMKEIIEVLTPGKVSDVNNDVLANDDSISSDDITNDYIDFKRFVTSTFALLNENINKINKNTTDQIETLKAEISVIETVKPDSTTKTLNDEIAFLKHKLEEKSNENSSLKNEIESQKTIIELLQQNRHENIQHQNNWTEVRNKNKTRRTTPPNIETTNKFKCLTVDELSPHAHNQANSNEPNYRRVVPGNSSYAETTKSGKRITVFGDSIVSSIKRKEMNLYIQGNVRINTFKSATSNDMYTGTNDISFRSTKSPKDIAASILQIGTKCRDAGVNNVLISSITKRKNFGLQKIINEVNDFLADGCNINRFTFINNSNIVENDIMSRPFTLVS